MDPFINKRIKGAQLPFMFKFELVEDIATMQYKLFSPFLTWLPKPPALGFIEDGHLPEVAIIIRDPFEWCMGKDTLHPASSTPVGQLSKEQLDRSALIARNEDLFIEMAAETAEDMLTRFAREENGIFGLQKRLALPNQERNKDFLTRQNTTTQGYIVWLQDS